MAKETTVWIKPLDLPWEQVGTGGFQGITPENVNLEADTWGPSNATFDLRREPDAPALDLSAGAEVEVHVAGVNVWDGFVSSTPKKRGDLVTSVVCRGWQDELDGRIFTAGYVHTSLSDFKDARSFVDTTLGSAAGQFAASPSVSTDKGITLMWPKSTVVAAYGKCGVILDLGPNLTGKRVVMTWESSNNDASTQAIVGGSDASAGPSTGTDLEDIVTFALNSGASGTNAATFTTARRYISVRLQDTGSGHTPAADVWLKITGLQVFADTAYESGNASILKASTVVKDALAKGTLALSTDTSGVEDTAFSIPDLWPTGELTARELISKVNAYHNWTAKLEPGRRFVFRARTTVPKVKVGEWSALPDDEDASSNDITDIYNHCRATSTEPGGQLVIVDRYSRDTALAKYAVVEIANSTGSGASTTRSVNGSYTVTKGKQYRIDFDVNFRQLTVGGVDVLALKSWGFNSYVFIAPTSGTVTAKGIFGGSYNVNFTLQEERSTVLDRRGRIRSQILDATAALPADGVALTQLADTWLAAHMTTPFKGKQSIQGAQSVRDYLTGDNVAPERLLAMTGDLLHFDDRIDPDTGDVGRDGRLVKVAYQPLTDTAQSDVDSTRSDFGALLVRIGVLTAS